MAKLIRPAYPLNFTIGLLFLIFFLSGFISFEIFDIKWKDVIAGENAIFAMLSAGVVGVIVALILWEEFLFPVRIRPIKDEIVFRNHFTKLKTQIAIYCLIPVIVVVLYINFEVRLVQFAIWACVCLGAPLVGRLSSGIKNYNDFLKLTDRAISYKNNEEQGVLPVNNIAEIICIRDEADVLHKLTIVNRNGSTTTIDLDEMELADFYETIDEFVTNHYKSLVRQEA